MKIRLNELLLEVRECLERKNIPLKAHLSSSRRVVEVFLERLIEYPDQPWSLTSMAAKCGLSETTFSSYCVEFTNMTPMAYLNRVRLERAAAMLQEEARRPITEIALNCGFSSSQYFATQFKRRFGCPPSDFQR